MPWVAKGKIIYKKVKSGGKTRLVKVGHSTSAAKAKASVRARYAHYNR